MQADVVRAVSTALNRTGGPHASALAHSPAAYVNHVIVPDAADIMVDREELRELGVAQTHTVDSTRSMSGKVSYDAGQLVVCLRQLLCALPAPAHGE